MTAMKTSGRKSLTAWGRSSWSLSRLWTPENEADVLTGIRAAEKGGLIARGYGRSYGDACLNEGGEVIDTTRLSVIQSFDAETGLLTCSAGTSFRTIVRHYVPVGWLPFACPGTAFVTMGGAVANDVHGKNQCTAGSFGNHIQWFDLRLADGTMRRVSRETDPDLFAATVGGIGLTGVIQTVQFRLQRIPSNAMNTKEIRVRNLEDFLNLLQSGDREYPYVVGWLDALSIGRHMGRGILELARPSAQSESAPWPLAVSVPFEFPSFALNRHSVRAFNACYFWRVPGSARIRSIHLERFLFPLDAIHNWNRMYGRRGMFQFQCVVPAAEGKRAIYSLMDEVVRSREPSFLAVLKSMERHGEGMLSFPMPGFTLTLDFPRSQKTHRLLVRLHNIVLDYGGRVYLAKDACLSPKHFHAMYPKVERFKAVLRRVDPGGMFQSDMSRRLGLSAR